MHDAEPRPRRWRRRMRWLIPLAIVALLLGWWGVFRYRAQQRVERALAAIRANGEPVTLAELDRWYPQPRGRNAATAYVRAFTFYVRDKDLENKIPSLSFELRGWPPPGEPLTAESVAAMEACLAMNAKALRILHETDAAESRYPIDLRAGAGVLMPYLGELRRGAMLLDIEAMLHAHRGEPAAAAECIYAILRLADSLRREPILISALVRISIVALAAQTLEQTMHRCEYTPAQLRSLQAALAASDDRDSIARALIGERALGLDAFRGLAAGRGLGMTGGLRYAGPLLNTVGWLDADKRVYLETMAQEIDAARRGDWAEMEGRAPIARKYLVSSMIKPALAAAAKNDLQLRATIRAAVVGVALQRYRLDRGRLPERIDGLVPRYLEAIPVDPFTEQPLRYKTADGKAVVYSLGSDGTDDGGRPADDGGNTYRPGTDIAFTLPAAAVRPAEANP